MKTRKLHLLTTLTLLTALAVPVGALDYSGTCTGTIAAAGSPHQLTGSCTVPAGETLTIGSGTTLDGQGYDLWVEGTLNADGVMFNQVDIRYRDGSGGTLENSTIEGSTPIDVYSSSQLSPTAPTIRNNTIVATSTAIRVSGTARPTITGNTLSTNWRAIAYDDTSAGSASGNQIDFFLGGSSHRIGIQINDSASPLVSSNTLGDDPDHGDVGIELAITPASTAQVTQNDICATGDDLALDFHLGFFAQTAGTVVMNNVFSCGLARGFGIADSTGAAATTLASLEGETRFVLTGSLSVGSGESLTLEPGLTLSTGNGSTVYVYGTLDADGVSFTDVSINYYSGSGGTLENSTLSGSNPLWVYSSVSATPATPTIRGNTIVATSTAIDVYGHAAPIIEGNTLTTNYRGIVYDDHAGGSATGNVIGFTPNSGSGRRAIDLDENASPLVDGNTLLDDPDQADVGIALEHLYTVSDATITNNTICATGEDEPLRFDPDFFSSTITVAGNSLACGIGAGFTLSGSVDSDTTLQPVSGVGLFRMVSTISIDPGQRLVVPSDITLDGDFHTFYVDGTLEVDGAELRDTIVRFRAGGGGSVMNSTITGPASSSPALHLTDASPTISGNSFSGMTTAIDLNGSTNPSITGNIFDSLETAIQLEGAQALSTVSGNTFINTTHSLEFLDDEALFAAFPTDFASNTFLGRPWTNLLLLPSRIDTSGTFPSSPVAYRNDYYLDIYGGAQVVMPAGTVIASTNGRDIVVEAGSRLVATGLPDLPVVFTDFDPHNGSRWGNLVIRDDTSFLDHCIVEFSGSDGLRLESSSITVSNCVFADNGDDGLDLTGDSTPTLRNNAFFMNQSDGILVNLSAPPLPGFEVTIEDNSIFSNGGFGIQNTRNDFDVRGVINYWGHDSGPRDTSDDTATGGLYNPGGQGESVSDGVFYDPWIRIGPSQEGVITPLSGGGQSASVGSTLPQPLVVEIESLLGTPLENIEVIFSVAAGDAAIVESQPLLTDAQGRAAATVQLGLTPGPVEIVATARDVNSPLATFMGTSDGPSMLGLEALPLELDLRPGFVGQTGDVDGDGRVNNLDAVLLQAVLEGLLPLNSPHLPTFASGDVNGDGSIDGDDVFLIQGVQVGLVGSSTGPVDPPRLVPTAAIRIELPERELAAGDVFDVPIYADDQDLDLASYALRVNYDAQALTLLDVEGGTFASFSEPPLSHRRRAGQLDFTAINHGFSPTPDRYSLARLRFEVRETRLDAAEISLQISPEGGVVEGGSFSLVGTRVLGGGTVSIDPAAGDVLPIFSDDFETGHVGTWSAVTESTPSGTVTSRF